MARFKVVRVGPKSSERSRVLIKEILEEGAEETIITFSTLKKSRGLAIEPRNYAQIASERIPLKVIKEAFMNL